MIFLTFEEHVKGCHLVLHLGDQCFKIHETTFLVLCDTAVKLERCLPCCGTPPVQDNFPGFTFLGCRVENTEFDVGLQVKYRQNLRSLIKDLNLKAVIGSVCSDNRKKLSKGNHLEVTKI